MLRRLSTSTGILLLIYAVSVQPLWAQYAGAYSVYMNLGRQALEECDFHNAIYFFEQAHLAYPSREEPLIYINNVKRRLDQRLEVIQRDGRASIELPPIYAGRPVQTEPSVKAVPDISVEAKKPRAAVPAETMLPERKESRETIMSRELDRWEKRAALEPSPEEPTRYRRPLPSKQAASIPVLKEIELDEALKATQPGTRVILELNSYLIIKGKNIDRFLALTPGFVSMERVDRDRIKLTGRRRGSTFVHVWDDNGRWTLHVEVTLPVLEISIEERERMIEESVPPFRLAYSVDWSSYYLGRSFDDMHRANLDLLQWIGMYGETPYGFFDAGTTYNKFKESTELIGYTVGLTDAHVGKLRDFNIRGFDASASFSPLSLPGQSFRGILIETLAFNKNLEIRYLQGQNRFSFGYLPTGAVNLRQAYIEGVQMTLFPRRDNQYSVNFARGFGDFRENFLKDRVFSIEARRRFRNLFFSGEAAYDEETFAETLGTRGGDEHFQWEVNARHIDKDFATITSFPANQGEIGGVISAYWNFENFYLNSIVDLYRDRFLPNPEEPSAINLDFNTSIDVPISSTDRLTSSLYYLDTPGEISPRRNLRFNTNYSKRFNLTPSRDLTTFIGGTYQRSRFSLAPISEFDRYSAMAGFSLPLMKGLNYYLNYEYSWVDEIFSGELLKPSVLTSGFNYSKLLTDEWTTNFGLFYRDEENTEGINSFLAGEDSLTGTMGLSYRPKPDVEIFINSSLRNIWREGPRAIAFNDFDIRAGLRSAWDLPFSWNPSGEIEGIVFKDLNGNQKRDPGEEGMEHIAIKVGRQKVFTDKSGRYRAEVRAKKVQVAMDVETVPKGFIFSTPSIQEVNVALSPRSEIDFGLTSQSGIYGLVYFDHNGNGQPDPDDEYFSRVRLILDGEQVAFSDFDGSYYFRNIRPGKHVLQIDVNSLPILYLPRVKVKTEVEVFEGTTYLFHIPVVKSERTHGK